MDARPLRVSSVDKSMWKKHSENGSLIGKIHIKYKNYENKTSNFQRINNGERE